LYVFIRYRDSSARIFAARRRTDRAPWLAI
jgi:hypothetical protein